MWYDSRTATAALRLPVALLLLAAAGCSGQEEPPATLPPQTMSPVASPPGGDEEVIAAAVPATAQPQAQAPAQAVGDEQRDPSIIVVDRGEASPAQPVSLYEASRKEKERRETSEDATIVITDKTLKEHATGDISFSEVSTLDTAISESAQDAGQTPAGGEEEKQERGEQYWRRRGLEIRMAWRDEVDSIEELEKEVFMLRQRFYAEDDPFYRDGQVKPAWDRALEQLEDARVGAKERGTELQEFLEEGRKAGALPGWLREGTELEPDPPDELEPGEQIQGHEPREPTVIEVHEGGAK